MTLFTGDIYEQARLNDLKRLGILDTGAEKAFDGIVDIVADLFDVPTALVSLVDEDRQWFKARTGLDAYETPRCVSFCAHAIAQPDIMEICDARDDPRFADNALVTGAPHIRYYAGAPLITHNGYAIGSLCIIDYKPRSPLSPLQRKLLNKFAQQVIEQIEIRHLRQTGNIAKLVSKTTSDALIFGNMNDRITWWNDAAEAMFGWTRKEAIGAPLTMIMPDRMKEMHRAGMRRMANGTPSKIVGKLLELPAIHRDGHEFPIEMSLAQWDDKETGKPIGFASLIRDISERKTLENENAKTRRFLRDVFEHLPAMVFVKDAETRQYKSLNKAGEELIGRSKEDIIDRTDEELWPDMAAASRERDDTIICDKKPSLYESEFIRPDGEARRIRTKRVYVDSGTGEPYILGICDDITERHEAEMKIAHMALHDPLTGLRNRTAIERDFIRLSGAMDKQGMAVLYLDLDRFKTVNDLLGHGVGDNLLRQFSARLREILPDDAAACRVGGDEFLAIVPARNPEQRAANLASLAIRKLSQDYIVDDKPVHMGVSIGISVSTDCDNDFEAMCQSADRALYRAKHQGRGQFCFFDEAMDDQATERRLLEVDLRNAISSRQLELHYQPLACLETGKINGFEALARWNHPKHGQISPEIFIPIAEESGLVNELGRFVLEAAISEASGWEPPQNIAVNLSPAQFRDTSLVENIEALLDKHSFDPSRLELEITEGFLIKNTTEALAILEALRNLGVRIAMDDFGTGYSSLSYFRMFPFDKVKIDQSFVQDMTHNSQSLAIVQAVIGLGKGLGLNVVAEGVETEEQLVSLRREGCSSVQGYHIGRPQPIDHFPMVVKRGPVRLKQDIASASA